jgi:hypothetical protein
MACAGAGYGGAADCGGGRALTPFRERAQGGGECFAGGVEIAEAQDMAAWFWVVGEGVDNEGVG